MRRRARPDAGFTYLGLLLFVAITAAALAALGQSWSQAAQRERERELEFRGAEIARAIVSYRRAVLPQPQYPRSLDDLLADSRGPKTLHHLRRAYVDPFTGQADWVLMPDPAAPDRFLALHSRSDHALLRELQPNGSPMAKASDWVFSAADYEAALPAPAASAAVPASAATAALFR